MGALLKRPHEEDRQRLHQTLSNFILWLVPRMLGCLGKAPNYKLLTVGRVRDI